MLLFVDYLFVKSQIISLHQIIPYIARAYIAIGWFFLLVKKKYKYNEIQT